MKHLFWVIIFAIETAFLICIDIHAWQRTPKDFQDKVDCYALGAFAIVAIFACIYHVSKYLKKPNYNHLHY